MCSGSTPNFSRTPAALRTVLLRRSTCTTRSPRTHCARSLSGVQMQTCWTLVVRDGDARGRGERVVGLQLDHRPDEHAHGRQALLERLELRAQRAVDAGAGLVARPEVVAERLDDVVGRDADVRRSGLEHLQHGVQHAGRGAERLIVALAAAAAAVEVAEQLVGAVDEVDDHRGAEDGRPRPASPEIGRGRRRARQTGAGPQGLLRDRDPPG